MIIPVRKKNIDIWLLSMLESNFVAPNISLLLQIGALMHNAGFLSIYKLRVISIIDSKDAEEEEMNCLKELLHITRVRAKPEVVCIQDSDFQELGLSINEITKKAIAKSENIDSIRTFTNNTMSSNESIERKILETYKITNKIMRRVSLPDITSILFRKLTI